MAHQPGWIELYEVLEAGGTPSPRLVKLCKSSRTPSTGETMLHWYAIEGSPLVLEALIRLGFDVDTRNWFDNTPLMEAAVLGRDDIVRVLLRHGADTTVRNRNGEDVAAMVRARGGRWPLG